MTECSFGDMKYNDKIQKFNHRSREKVYKEMLFYIIGRNLKKHHKFLNNSLKNCEKELRKKADLEA
ncbi:MAG: hypothetical protein N4A76_00670 [Firmicutes bacterium]|jgi:hypothetical protein|nr:hypothetical protein [Bacillota bacterium]